MKSNLDLVDECDNFPPSLPASRKHEYDYGLLTDGPDSDTVLGYVHPKVMRVLNTPSVVISSYRVAPQSRSVAINGDTETERSANVAAVVRLWWEEGWFEVLDGWRDELYPVYHPRTRELLFSVERAASALFGVVTYGVHMTVFTSTPTGEMMIWVPRRAKTKQTYPGLLDNSVAGGISTGEGVFKSLVREAREEASLPEALVREKAVAVGAVTYMHVRDERAGGETGLLQPECEYVFDLELDGGDATPRPGDEEVEAFNLMSVPEVQAALGRGEFKPNCALVLLDFFVRHGVLTSENERDYDEIVARLHRNLRL
ncbi:MAG: hypothetical protein M1832_005308 [Thelocarpon impressellum]|nr:MAG: hypothetical protein M1832_005308 [Thelocarpon impressellum]